MNTIKFVLDHLYEDRAYLNQQIEHLTRQKKQAYVEGSSQADIDDALLAAYKCEFDSNEVFIKDFIAQITAVAK